MKKFIEYLKQLFTKKQASAKDAPTVETKPEPVKAESPKPVDSAPWMTVARKELGQKEIPGTKHNKRIIEYHDKTSLSANDDETAWCASFVSWVLDEAGYKSPKTARARDFLNYGTKLDKPMFGCLVIYDRGEGKGHVHFYESETPTYIYGLGGNQSNEVNVQAYQKAKVLGYRWPVKK